MRTPFFPAHIYADMLNLPIMHLTAKRSNPESCVGPLRNSTFFLDILHAHTVLIHQEIPCLQPSVFFSGKVHCTLFKLLFFKVLFKKIYKVFWAYHYLHQKRLMCEVTPKLYVGNYLVNEISKTFSTLLTKGKIYFIKWK